MWFHHYGATFGVGLANYLNSVLPGINLTVTAVICVLLFYLLNLVGINLFAKVQNVMTVALVFMLILFGVCGLPRLRPGIMQVTNDGFLMNGPKGLILSVTMFLFSTVAYQILLNFSGQAKNPKKDIPRAMLVCIAAITVVYELVTVTATGVLPVSEVANKPLTFVAASMWPYGFTILFVVSGPIMALGTTLNANIAGYSQPLLAAAEDGWFPAAFARKNRFGSPFVIYSLGTLIALIPIVMGWDFQTIIRNMVVIFNSTSLFIVCAAWNLPTKCPKSWEKSPLHMGNAMFKIIVSISFAAIIGSLFIQFRNINATVIGFTVGVYLIIGIYSLYRFKKGLVKIDKGRMEAEEA